jgi:hypothetical protein
MEFTIQKLDVVVDDKRGYAFIDKNGNCIIITFGETNVKNCEQILQR